ncbi:unnamed protein product [Orchesella dallaii]|uniref:CCHC-type domain-containing protein n=1 Tax=Orchesella dallaii TaxID=48710 RepID=A0ABP1RQW9_9HEXA
MLNQSTTMTSAMEKQMESIKDMMSKLTTVVSVNALQSSSKPPTPPPSRRPFAQGQSMPYTPQVGANGFRRSPRFPGKTADGLRICFRCNQPGHLSSHCQNEPFCPKCQINGHTLQDCSPSPRRQTNSGNFPGHAPKGPPM